jgi:hypothetical protein
VDERSFEALTRRLGETQTRREALRVILGAGIAAVVVACGGAVPATVVPSRGPKDECPTASICDGRQYCDEKQSCICVKSAEGNLRCGQLPTTCDVPLCKTSADCEAALGVKGAFCDTPNSGCCTDPPAELPRCLLPCGATAAVTPEASPYATAVPAASPNGTSAPASTTAPGPTVKPATVTCPANGTCSDFRLTSDNRAVTKGPCSDPGIAASACASANEDPAFTLLAGRLLADGYRQVAPTSLEATRVYGGDGLERTGFVGYFAHATDKSRTAELVFTESAWGEKQAFVGFLVSSKGERVMALADDGTLEERPVKTPTGTAGVALAAYRPQTAAAFDCGGICGLICGQTTGLASGIASTLFCTNPWTCGVLVFGVIIGTLAGVGCNVFCDSYCSEPAQRVYCGCTRGCFSNLGDCQANCRVVLGACFAANICGPDPICSTPLKEFKP